jgi:hypothetical protein
VLYLALLYAVPEPRYVFGPQGPRWVPAVDGVEPQVVADESASHHRKARRGHAMDESVAAELEARVDG